MQIESSHLTFAAAMEGGKQPNMALKLNRSEKPINLTCFPWYYFNFHFQPFSFPISLCPKKILVL